MLQFKEHLFANYPVTRLFIENPEIIKTAHRVASEVADPFNNRRLMRAFTRLTVALKPHLASYDMILADDAAGRMPALVIHALSMRKRSSEAKEKPDLRFIHPIIDIAPRYANFDQSLDAHRASWHRVLLVTEYIQSGTSAALINNIVSDYDMALDVATICSKYTPSSYTNIQGCLFTGEVGLIGKEVIHDHKQRDLFQGAATQEGTITAYGVPSTPETITARTRARQDVATIAEGLWPLVA